MSDEFLIPNNIIQRVPKLVPSIPKPLGSSAKTCIVPVKGYGPTNSHTLGVGLSPLI